MNSDISKEMCGRSIIFDCSEHFASNEERVNKFLIRINQMSAQTHKSTLRGGADTIRIHPSLEFLLENEYYNKETLQIGSRYNIIFDENIDRNIVYVYFSENYNPKILTTIVGNNIVMKINKKMVAPDKINLVSESVYASEEEVEEYIKRGCGYIEIINL